VVLRETLEPKATPEKLDDYKRFVLNVHA